VEAGLHPERVARAEPDRRRALRDHGVPDGGRGLRRDEQLDAVLAGVAGAADEHVRHAGDGERGGPEPLRQLAVREPRDQRARVRPLHREHREVAEPIPDGRVVRARMALEPREVGLVVARVRDGQEAVGPEPVREQVVEHAAPLVAQNRVLGAALGDVRDVVGEQLLEERLGFAARGLDLPHVADVEDPDALAHCHVLLADAGVLDRHLPARERHQLRAGGDVAVVQRRAPECLRPCGHEASRTLPPARSVAVPIAPGPRSMTEWPTNASRRRRDRRRRRRSKARRRGR
jgi:hypothetical protein